jgi:cell division protein FtsN
VKRKRSWAFMTLIAATLAILAIGFYLGVTHQEARPADNGAAGTGP